MEQHDPAQYSPSFMPLGSPVYMRPKLWHFGNPPPPPPPSSSKIKKTCSSILFVLAGNTCIIINLREVTFSKMQALYLVVTRSREVRLPNRNRNCGEVCARHYTAREPRRFCKSSDVIGSSNFGAPLGAAKSYFQVANETLGA